MRIIPTAFLRAALAALVMAGAAGSAPAHGARAGDIEIGHPFATPSVGGNGAAYLATLHNAGRQADRLLSATTPAAAATQIHTMAVDAGGVMRMREVGEIALAPDAVVKMRPGNGHHLMLMGLKQPLKEGDTFPMTLQFERAGKVEVKVVVQVPRATAASGAAAGDAHKH